LPINNVEKHSSPFTPKNTSTPLSQKLKVIKSSSFGFVQENETELFEYSFNTDYSSADNFTIAEYIIICFLYNYIYVCVCVCVCVYVCVEVLKAEEL
jgi:hypothetical protein